MGKTLSAVEQLIYGFLSLGFAGRAVGRPPGRLPGPPASLALGLPRPSLVGLGLAVLSYQFVYH